jgi:MFS family permease
MARSLWIGRDFAYIWVGTSISALGSSLSALAYPLLVISIGGSLAQAGVIGTVSLVTRIVFRLPAGHLVDYVDRRMLMISLDLARLIAVGSVPAFEMLGRLAVGQLFIVAVLEGAATASYLPASMVLLRERVAGEERTRALSRVQGANSVIMMIGPVLGGALFAIVGTLPFLLDSISYVFPIAALLLLPRTTSTVTPHHGNGGVTAGLRWIWRDRVIMRGLLFTGVLNLATAMAEIVVLLTMRVNRSAPGVIGLVMGCAGVGGIVGSVLAPRVLSIFPGTRLYLFIGLGWTIGSLGLRLTSDPVTIGVTVVALVFLLPPAGIRHSEMTMTRAPKPLLGRVIAAQGLLSTGLASVGPWLAGEAVERIGRSATWYLLACLFGLATCIAMSITAGERVADRTPRIE